MDCWFYFMSTIMNVYGEVWIVSQLFRLNRPCDQCPGKFLGIIGWYPSVSSSTRYILDIVQFSLLNLVCTINSSEMIGNFLKS